MHEARWNGECEVVSQCLHACVSVCMHACMHMREMGAGTELKCVRAALFAHFCRVHCLVPLHNLLRSQGPRRKRAVACAPMHER